MTVDQRACCRRDRRPVAPGRSTTERAAVFILNVAVRTAGGAAGLKNPAAARAEHLIGRRVAHRRRRHQPLCAARTAVADDGVEFSGKLRRGKVRGAPLDPVLLPLRLCATIVASFAFVTVAACRLAPSLGSSAGRIFAVQVEVPSPNREAACPAASTSDVPPLIVSDPERVRVQPAL